MDSFHEAFGICMRPGYVSEVLVLLFGFSTLFGKYFQCYHCHGAATDGHRNFVSTCPDVLEDCQIHLATPPNPEP